MTTMECKIAGKTEISSDITVKELLERKPGLMYVFWEMKLLCVGCPAEAFHTLAEVAKEYKLDVDQLLTRINESVRDESPPQ